MYSDTTQADDDFKREHALQIRLALTQESWTVINIGREDRSFPLVSSEVDLGRRLECSSDSVHP